MIRKEKNLRDERGYEKDLQDLKEKEKKILFELSENMKGNLRCAINHGNYQYYIDGKYVKKSELDRAERIATRDYYNKLLPELKRKIELLLDIINDDSLARAYTQLPPARQALIQPLFETKEVIIERWQAEEYEPFGFDEEDETEFYTQRGERVRSKSEMIIANELLKFGVPYKYEPPLELWERKGTRIYRPDFMVLNKRTLKEIVIEHWGMMDNLDYVNHNVYKWDLYEKNDYLLGDNILVFHETSTKPLSVLTVDKYIEEFLI